MLFSSRVRISANGFAVFRRPPPVAPDPSLSADRHVPDAGGRPCANSFRLWQCSVLAGLLVYLVRRLQPVLNAAARLTYHSRRSDHISDALACLHWLRVSERIELRSPSWFIVVHRLAPGYLGLFTRVADLPSRRSLRSVDRHLSPGSAYQHTVDCCLLVAELFGSRAADLEWPCSRKTWHQQNHWPHFVASSRHTSIIQEVFSWLLAGPSSIGLVLLLKPLQIFSFMNDCNTC